MIDCVPDIHKKLVKCEGTKAGRMITILNFLLFPLLFIFTSIDDLKGILMIGKVNEVLDLEFDFCGDASPDFSGKTFTFFDKNNVYFSEQNNNYAYTKTFCHSKVNKIQFTGNKLSYYNMTIKTSSEETRILTPITFESVKLCDSPCDIYRETQLLNESLMPRMVNIVSCEGNNPYTCKSTQSSYNGGFIEIEKYVMLLPDYVEFEYVRRTLISVVTTWQLVYSFHSQLLKAIDVLSSKCKRGNIFIKNERRRRIYC